jgi:hypothetical protein
MGPEDNGKHRSGAQLDALAERFARLVSPANHASTCDGSVAEPASWAPRNTIISGIQHRMVNETRQFVLI